MKALQLDEYESFYKSEGVRIFECGLSLDAAVADTEVSEGAALLFANAHQRHHDEGHEKLRWALLTTTIWGDDAARVETVFCDCE